MPRGIPHLMMVVMLILPVQVPAASRADTVEYFVSPSGDDANPGTTFLPWKTIQHAALTATPGSTVYIASGVYNEKVSMGVSGTGPDDFITFRNAPGDTAVLDGTGIPGDQLILIHNRSYLRIRGLELRNNLGQSFGTGIWITGGGSHIEIIGNRIHDMKAAPGGDAMAISVYGTDPVVPLSDVVVSGNEIYDCEPGHSEALTLNGNVENFEVSWNTITDVDNIGIDMIGGEGTCPTYALDVARDGVCRGNTVTRARSNYGGGYAAGIYVDGGVNILVEGNLVRECDIGMEIGCENKGRVTSGIVVRDNILYNNDKGGLAFGGYNYPSTGKVTASLFRNNTVFNNDVLNTGTGELWIQQGENCTVTANIFYSAGQNRLMTTTIGAGAGNLIDYNLWYAPGGSGAASVDWDGDVFTSFPAYLLATGNDGNSVFGDPDFFSDALPSPDVHLNSSSPAIDAADPGILPDTGETDYFGSPRLLGEAIDAGAVEQVVDSAGPPAAVSLFAADAAGLETTLRWGRSRAGDFAAYRIYGGTTPAPVTVMDSVAQTADTVTTLTGLGKNLRYYFRVTVVDLGAEESVFSNELSVLTFTPGAPAKPQLISAREDTGGVRLQWQAVPGAEGYRLQVSADQDFGVAEVLDTMVTDLSVAVALSTDSTVYSWRVNAGGAGGTGAWSDAWNFTHVAGNITTAAGHKWSLVSLAGLPADGRAQVIFPSATSEAFGFHSTYSEVETLKAGSGYWMKFNGRQDVTYTGVAGLHDTVEVEAGWNMIGALSVAIPVSDVVAQGTAISSPFYRYDAGYSIADSLRPGYGYWVKVDGPGALIMDATGTVPVIR